MVTITLYQIRSVAQSCLTLSDPMDYMVHGILQAGVSSLSLLRGIFPTQGSNPGLNIHNSAVMNTGGHASF